MNPRLSSTLRAALPLVVFLSVVAVLAYAVVPLTYDEAYNWRQFASRGWRVACCDYEAPNNHVFFSIISGALNSQATIDRWPFFVRLPNMLVVAAFTVLLAWTVFRGHRWNTALAAALLWSTPLTLRYSLLGRGYLLGTLLLVAGIYLLAKKPLTAWLPLALSAYTVPTFVLHWPGIFLVALFRRPVAAIISAALALGTAILLYWPIIPRMRETGTGQVVWPPKWASWSDALNSALHVPAPFGAVVAGLAIAAAILLAFVPRHAHRDGGRISDERLFGIGLLAACASYLLISAFMPHLFIRNGLALGLLLIGALVVLARDSAPWVQRLGGAAFGANLLLGLCLFAMTAFRPGGFTRDRSFMELTPAPFTAKHWSRLTRNATAIDCRGYAEWPCNLFNGTFAAHHISRENISNASGRCLIGSAPYPGVSGSDMFVRMKYGDAGRLCFP